MLEINYFLPLNDFFALGFTIPASCTFPIMALEPTVWT